MEGAVKGQRQQRPQRLGGEKGSLEWGCWAGECCGLGVTRVRGGWEGGYKLHDWAHLDSNPQPFLSIVL